MHLRCKAHDRNLGKELFARLKASTPDTPEYKKITELIVQNNLGLAGYVLNAMRTPKDDDFESAALFGLFKAIRTFDITKGVAFNTYGIKVITNEILMLMRYHKKHNQNCISLETPIATDCKGNTLHLVDTIPSQEIVDAKIEKAVTTKELRKAVSCLGERDRMIIFLRFFRGLAQNVTAEKLGVSQALVSKLEKKVLIRLKTQIGGDAIDR